MKRNHSPQDTQKKLLLTTALASVLLGPAISQFAGFMNSSTSGSIHMSSAATPAAPAASTATPSATPAAASTATASPSSGGAAAVPMTPDALREFARIVEQNAKLNTENTEIKAQVAAISARAEALEKALAERARLDDEAKRTTDTARTEEERKRKEAEAKKQNKPEDCEKLERASERTECRKEQRQVKMEEAQDELKSKFEDAFATAVESCERTASRREDADQEVLVASCMSNRLGPILRRHQNMRIDGVRVQLDMNTVNEKFQESIGGVLSRLLYSDDPADLQSTNAILRSLMGSQIPAQFGKLKENAVKAVHDAGKVQASEVAAEYKKLNSPEIRNNQELYQQQKQVADSKRFEFSQQERVYSTMLGESLRQNASLNTSAIRYYQNTYVPDMNKIMLAINGINPSAVAGQQQDSTRNARGTVEAGTTIDGHTTRNSVDSKMRQTGPNGVNFTLQGGQQQGVTVGPASRDARGGNRSSVRVGTAQ